MNYMFCFLSVALTYFMSVASADEGTPSTSGKNDGVVLVYMGSGSCTEGCSEAAAEIPASIGYRIQYVKPEEIKAEIFKDAVVWIQPGGDAILAAQAIGPAGLALIREFVRGGGGYVGFCAGAFLADTKIDNLETIAGLGIIPVRTFDYPIDSHNGDGVMTWINWNGQNRHVFFNGGASFYINKSDNDVKVLARFADDNLPATIETHFGNGRVVVTGAHPEATNAWKTEVGLVDKDGPDYDLAVDMFRRARPHKR